MKPAPGPGSWYRRNCSPAFTSVSGRPLAQCYLSGDSVLRLLLFFVLSQQDVKNKRVGGGEMQLEEWSSERVGCFLNVQVHRTPPRDAASQNPGKSSVRLSLKAPRVTEVQLGLPPSPLHRHKGSFPSTEQARNPASGSQLRASGCPH